MVDFGANVMMPHFIYCGFGFEKLKEIILKKMREYGIQSSILTMLRMHRENLITKEKSKQAAEGKLKNEPGWRDYEGSINDDLDLFINNLQNSNEVEDEDVESFFLPKLTEEELELVEEKNREHMMSYVWRFDADVDVEEMKQSDSKDKYVRSTCLRETVHLSLESNQTPSSDSPSESSSDCSSDSPSNDSRSSSRKRRRPAEHDYAKTGLDYWESRFEIA